MRSDELKRLRKDFELQAGKYLDLTLSVYVESADRTNDPPAVRQPNHKVMLWQYLADALPSDGTRDPRDPIDFQMDRFGFVNASASAFALIEGPETGLFCRMASRAGSLIPDAIRLSLGTEIMANVVHSSSPVKPVFAVNSDPISTWLNFVLVTLAVFQPERFTRQKLPIDPFAASLAAFDHLLDRLKEPYPSRNAAPTSLWEQQFDVSLSFPGEKRPFVAQVAAGLRECSVKVFYDKDFEAELARPDLDVLLQRIYHDNSKLVVVFICRDYKQKEWCGLEWRAIRDLIKKKRGHNLMLFRFDDADVGGLLSIDGYIDLRDRTPEDAVRAILQRTAAQATD
jgi:hypothetical protein